MSKPPNLACLLESFFRRRLIEQRNVSPLTVATYRDALRLFVLYASRHAKREACRLEVQDLDRDIVLGFLQHVEQDRGNGPRTRNARLTAIRSFFRHVAASDPGSLAIAQRVLDIPCKRTVLKAPRHLSATAVDTLLDAPDQQTPLGRRDYALLLFLARTGARVSEAIGVNAADLRLDRPPHVLLRGKGRKERLVPLAPDIAQVLAKLRKERGLTNEPEPVFVGAHGERLTRFGATHVVRRAVRSAAVHLARARSSKGVAASASTQPRDAATPGGHGPGNHPVVVRSRESQYHASIRRGRLCHDATKPRNGGCDITTSEAFQAEGLRSSHP
jgi:integrase/recombinase XerD